MDDTLIKILVVDDNVTNLTMIKGILSKFYKVYPIDSGQTALRFLEKQTPSLILLDIEMPDMNGYEVLKIIKSNSLFSDIPVIFLTANNEIESEASAFKLGVSDYIRKPINDTILLTRVSMQLELASYRTAQKWGKL